MKPFTNFESRIVPLPINDVDTDQIIPARFLKTISKQGLDQQLFYDWRYDGQGRPKPDFILNQPRAIMSSDGPWPGAGSTLAGRAAAAAEPDGYTLLLASAATMAIGPALYNTAGYDPLTSFASIGMLSSVPFGMPPISAVGDG